QVHDAPQLDRCVRDTHRQQRVAGFGRGDQVTNRANTANAGHQRGHFGKGPPFAELFKPSYLGDVETGILDLSGCVKLDSYFGVPLNASYWIDNNAALFHGITLQSAFYR